MQAAVDECYERIGRYLDPDISAVPIRMGSSVKHIPHQGRCERTGLIGLVVDHKKSEAGTVVPTHTKLLWMVGYQNRKNRDGTFKPYRLLGNIALLPDVVLSTIDLAAPIPGLRVIERTKELVKQAIAADRYLFLSFGKNTDRTLGNGLRYSVGGRLEVNGELKIAGGETINQSIDFRLPRELAGFVDDVAWDDIYRYCTLRSRTPQSETEQRSIMAEMQTIRGKLGRHARTLLVMSRQVTKQDLRLGRWLSQ
jgi:hypothetical protein